MANYSAYLSAPAGGTYYAYPVNKALSQWATYRVLFVDALSDGSYTATLNGTNGMVWLVYSGATQPANRDSYVKGPIDLTDAVALDAIDDIEGGGGGGTVDPDIIDESRTWIATGYRANNIVEVNASSGAITFSLKPDLNNATTINSVTEVLVEGAEEDLTASDEAPDRSRLQAHFTIETLTAGTYTVSVTVLTVDGQTIKTTGTLKVH